MTSSDARATLSLALSPTHEAAGIRSVRTVTIANATDVITFRSYALLDELLGASPEIVVGRCGMCFDDMCGYRVARVERDGESVTWTVEDTWFEPLPSDEEDAGWRRGSRAQFIFEALAYDAELERARTLSFTRESHD